MRILLLANFDILMLPSRHLTTVKIEKDELIVKIERDELKGGDYDKNRERGKGSEDGGGVPPTARASVRGVRCTAGRLAAAEWRRRYVPLAER